MELNFNKEFKNIVVSGDIHGEIKTLVNKVQDQYRIEDSLIIVAGDSGVGFKSNEFYLTLFKKASYRLQKKNNTLLLLRGNHDRKSAWTDPAFEKYWQEGSSNIRLLKDYTVVMTESPRGTSNILCVGGAISVDRHANPDVHDSYGKPHQGRFEGKDYWADEAFVYDEDKIKDLVGITHVITHSCPTFCQPITKSGMMKWLKHDPDLNADVNKERNDHTMLYNKVVEKNSILKWFYGHFHFSSYEFINGTMFRLLDIMEIGEL